MAHYRTAIALDPEVATAHFGLSVLFLAPIYKL
jgi:hypothetical protein